MYGGFNKKRKKGRSGFVGADRSGVFSGGGGSGKQDIEARMDVFEDCFFVAETNGKIVGFINGAVAKEASLPDQMYHDASLHDPNGAYQTVFGLDVLPAYRRNGIAGRLLER